MQRSAEPATGDTAIAARDHIPALDGLRGVAILLVIPHNADVFSNSAAWLWPVAILAHAGWLGVQLFFVLSGFLITRNLLDSRGAPNYLRAFFGRRVLRIFPLYFGTLFVALVLIPHVVQLSPGALASHRNQVWLWTFTLNWAAPFGADVSGFSHFWSLAVEEQFYLFWPFVVMAAAGTRLFRICIAVAGLAVVSRVVMHLCGATPDMLYTFTNCRMDALALGAAVAVIGGSANWRSWIAAHRQGLLIAIFGVLLVTAGFSHLYSVFDPRTLLVGQTTIAASFALLVACLAARPPGKHRLDGMLEMKWLRTVGRYSYAMYVFHLPILTALGGAIWAAVAFSGSARPLLFAFMAIVLSFIAGWLSWHLVEKHFLRLKSRIAPQSPTAASATRTA
jgi:peptidoglycan/LPS O-acetylase OafA/YrhL